MVIKKTFAKLEVLCKVIISCIDEKDTSYHKGPDRFPQYGLSMESSLVLYTNFSSAQNNYESVNHVKQTMQ